MGRNFLVIVLCIVSLHAYGQDVEVRGGFLQDSFRVGEPVRYWLSAKYPTDRQVVFPGAGYDFSPFEFTDIEYFASQSDSALVADSAVYTLISFELDSLLFLSLPAFVVGDGDSIAFKAREDQIAFQPMVTQMPDSLILRSTDQFYELDQEFNYVVLVYWLAGLAVLLLLVALVFGKKLRAKYRAYRLRKAFDKFSKEFEKMTSGMRENPEPVRVEETYFYWKRFLQTLEGRPLTSYSSTEINALYDDAQLRKHLLAVDRVVYGKLADPEVRHSLGGLKHFAHARYTEKLIALKTGRDNG